jgi:pyridoxal phosphate enzyme (YggS family)
MTTPLHPDRGPPRPDEALRGRCLENLARVGDEVAEACRRAGRAAESVRIVAVTKYVPVAWAAILLDAGCRDLGESRPQALWDRAAILSANGFPSDPVRWHLIGRLQRNKVRRTLPVVSLIHSLDSQRLLETLASEAATQRIDAAALVEVNLDGDPGRGGMAPGDVKRLLDAAVDGPVKIRGLMGMASAPGPSGDDGTARRQFAALRALRDRLATDHPGLEELSMGMSGDFVDGILEGATIVRIGSALWEGMPEVADATG